MEYILLSSIFFLNHWVNLVIYNLVFGSIVGGGVKWGCCKQWLTAAKHKETIKLNLSQASSGKETMLSPFIFDLNPLLKAKGHILLT